MNTDNLLNKQAVVGEGLELMGRGIAGLMRSAAGNSEEVDIAQRARGNKMVGDLLRNGAILGGGVGSLVVLSNYLKSINDEAQIDDESRLDDDTLYIDTAGHNKKAGDGKKGVNPWLAPGLAVTGGILTSGAAYALVNAIYNKIRKNQLENKLDEAQGEALDEANLEVNKSASLTYADLLTAMPVTLPLLAAIAAGGTSYVALRKAFPSVTPTKSKYPSRVRAAVDGVDYDQDQSDEADLAKSASDFLAIKQADQDCEASAMEFLTLMTDSIGQEKRAAVCVTSDILNKAAAGGTQELEDALMDGGIQAMAAVAKGAPQMPMLDKTAAAMALHGNQVLTRPVSALAAAELIDMVPAIATMSGSMSEDSMDKMAGLSALFNAQWFRGQLKEAMMAGLADTAALTSDVTGSLSEQNEGDEAALTPNDDKSRLGNSGQTDIVDAAMTGKGMLAGNMM